MTAEKPRRTRKCNLFKALRQAANPARVTTWLVPGAGHGGALATAPAEYRQRVIGFMATHRQPQR